MWPLLLLFILHHLSTVQVASQDCTNWNELWPLPDAYDCLRTIPFQPESYAQKVQDLVDLSDSVLERYVFGEVIRIGSGPPLHWQANMREQLLSRSNFPSFFDSEIHIRKAVDILGDGHFSIWMDTPHLYLVHGMGIDVRYDSVRDGMVVTAKPVNSTKRAYSTLMGRDCDITEEYEITHINGIDAYTFLLSEAASGRQVPFVREPSIAFNLFFIQYWYMPELPDDADVAGFEYTFFHNETNDTRIEQIGFAACVACAWYDCECDEDERCCLVTDEASLLSLVDPLQLDAPLGGRRSSSIGEREKLREEKKKMMEINDPLYWPPRLPPVDVDRETREGSRRALEEDYVLIAETEDGLGMACFYDANDDKIGVLKFLAFDGEFMMDIVHQCFTTFNEMGITKLIVDFRMNGGGSGPFMTALIWALMKRPRPGLDYIFGPAVLRPKLETMIREQRGAFQGLGYFATKEMFCWPKDLPEFTFSESSTYPYNNQTFEMTRWRLQLRFMGWDLPPEFRLEPENILFVTSGFCASACSMMMQYMRITESAKIVFLGGIRGAVTDTGFARGASTQGYFESYLLNGQWSDMGMFRPTIDALWDKSKMEWDHLTEFDRLEPDFTLLEDLGSYYDSFDPYEWDVARNVWEKVTPYFDRCVSWNIQIPTTPCTTAGTPILHGIYGHPCAGDGLSYNTGECVFKRCEEGFYINPARDTCLPEDDAPLWTGLGLDSCPSNIPGAIAGIAVGVIAFVVCIVLICTAVVVIICWTRGLLCFRPRVAGSDDGATIPLQESVAVAEPEEPEEPEKHSSSSSSSSSSGE